MPFFSGYKTDTAGWAMIVLGILGLFGLEIPGYAVEPGASIAAGVTAIGLRDALRQLTP